MEREDTGGTGRGKKLQIFLTRLFTKETVVGKQIEPMDTIVIVGLCVEGRGLFETVQTLFLERPRYCIVPTRGSIARQRRRDLLFPSIRRTDLPGDTVRPLKLPASHTYTVTTFWFLFWFQI